MYWRWFVGAYCTAVIAGFATTHWVFPTLNEPQAIAVGLFFLPFALPFVLMGALVGLLLQWAVTQLIAPGWLRAAVLIGLAALAAGLGVDVITHTWSYVLIGVCAAAAAGILALFDEAWRRAWLVIISAGLLTSAVVIGVAS